MYQEVKVVRLAKNYKMNLFTKFVNIIKQYLDIDNKLLKQYHKTIVTLSPIVLFNKNSQVSH